jgi:hypothetical protein
VLFPISRDPPEGGTVFRDAIEKGVITLFPISRDPPEGGTITFSVFRRMVWAYGNENLIMARLRLQLI